MLCGGDTMHGAVAIVNSCTCLYSRWIISAIHSASPAPAHTPATAIATASGCAAASSSSLGREFSHGLGACLRSAIVATTCDADQPSELAVARVLPLFVILA